MPAPKTLIDLTERRKRHPYEGVPRAYFGNGYKMVRFDQRKFALPKGGHVFKWTREDQRIAVDRGYFFERVRPDNHVWVRPLRHGAFFDNPYPSDQAVMNELERAAFHHDTHAMKALAFVEQQDKFGYSGAWEQWVERWTKHMGWYRNMTREGVERGSPEWKRRYPGNGRAERRRLLALGLPLPEKPEPGPKRPRGRPRKHPIPAPVEAGAPAPMPAPEPVPSPIQPRPAPKPPVNREVEW